MYDGIDNEGVNQNSGAESNIEAALALVDSLPWDCYSSNRSLVFPKLAPAGR